jgi:hypothetical protein
MAVSREMLIRLAAGAPGGGHLARLDQQIPLLHLVAVFEQAALRRSGGARAVRIVDAAVARAHEQPDCGNQRTGHPRCAQLIAKTWNFSPSTRRTQQGIFAVSPSDGFAPGCR